MGAWVKRACTQTQKMKRRQVEKGDNWVGNEQTDLNANKTYTNRKEVREGKREGWLKTEELLNNAGLGLDGRKQVAIGELVFGIAKGGFQNPQQELV